MARQKQPEIILPPSMFIPGDTIYRAIWNKDTGEIVIDKACINSAHVHVQHTYPPDGTHRYIDNYVISPVGTSFTLSASNEHSNPTWFRDARGALERLASNLEQGYKDAATQLDYSKHKLDVCLDKLNTL